MTERKDSDACTAFGDFVRERRKALRKTAREVALKIGMQPSNYCRLEFGAFQPPREDEKLRRLAEELLLPKDEPEANKFFPETHKFFNLAAKALGSVPADLAEIISHNEATPMMLRTLGCRKLTPADLDKIADIIRGKA